jgi:hypothetical protein
MTAVKDLLPVLVPLATVGAATIAAIPVYRQFKLKVAEENRLAVANRAELDVRLLTLFTELMGKAHARGLSILSESTVTKIIEQQGSLSPSSLSELVELLEACTVVYPVGTAEQDAAIAAIAELGGKYELLRFPAERALETIRNFKPATADNALDRLRRSKATRQ